MRCPVPANSARCAGDRHRTGRRRERHRRAHGVRARDGRRRAGWDCCQACRDAGASFLEEAGWNPVTRCCHCCPASVAGQNGVSCSVVSQHHSTRSYRMLRMLHAPDEAENEPRRDQHCHRTACRADCGNLCAVPGCACRRGTRCCANRTPENSACADHGSVWKIFWLTRGCNRCRRCRRAVAACTRPTDAARGYCNTHYQRWRNALAADPDLDTQQWQARESPVAEPGRVNLRALPVLVVVEVLVGIQQRVRSSARTREVELQVLCDGLRSRQVDSITTDRAEITRNKIVRALRTTLTQRVRRALADPDSEQIKDTWDLAVFGHHGSLSFAGISQPWLAQSVKQCAVQQLPRHRGRGAARCAPRSTGSGSCRSFSAADPMADSSRRR